MFQAGWAKRNIGITPRGYAMQGYGMWHHRAEGEQSPLFARAFFIADASGQALVFCCLDLGYVTHAMREGVCRQLRQEMGEAFHEEAFVLTCTHTHSGPGGCTQDALYNVVTPGFVPEHVERIVAASTAAILQAWRSVAPTEVSLQQGRFDDALQVAWNRSLRAYNRNPDVQPRREDETHLALDRQMQVLAFRREGRLLALLSLFGVHATCVGSGQKKHDGDNKGYAASHAEQELQARGSADAVAIFAQATAGDVSPHYHGPGQAARRRALRGAAEYAYARQNGQRQSEQALYIAETSGTVLQGGIDAIFSYADFSRQQADPAFAKGRHDARTSEPCHGVAFFTGTPVDGPGMPKALGLLAARLAKAVQKRRLENRKQDTAAAGYYQQLYAAQGPKAILLEAGRKEVLGQPLAALMLPDFADPLVKELKRQARLGALRESALVPSVLPLQILRLGSLALVCAPGEFTTTAGRRLRESVQAVLQQQGVAQVLLCTYCNEYMGYVTTFEEYQEQAYEGGHTVFGQWTLAAFQTLFGRLATELGKTPDERRHDRETRPVPPPAAELALRSNLPVPR
ncbi:MAG TPA: neutral/alkaline non-lysosomal ceramidase N-terminal domain-containing protein [Moraxellaceae bacterium]